MPVIAIPLSLGQEEISQFAEDQGRGLVVRKETLLAEQHQPLLQALRKVVVANSTGFKAQVWSNWSNIQCGFLLALAIKHTCAV